MNKCVPPPHSQTNLVINPAALLPSASPWILGVSGLPGLSPRPAWTQSPSDGGLSFDHPVQVSVLQCANKVGQGSEVRQRGCGGNKAHLKL